MAQHLTHPPLFQPDAMSENNFDEYDDEEYLSSHLAAQLARFELKQEVHERDRIRRQRRTLKVRRRLEDWNDKRRMRDEIDYLDG